MLPVGSMAAACPLLAGRCYTTYAGVAPTTAGDGRPSFRPVPVAGQGGGVHKRGQSGICVRLWRISARAGVVPAQNSGASVTLRPSSSSLNESWHDSRELSCTW